MASLLRRSALRCRSTACHAERASAGSTAAITATVSLARSDRRAIGPTLDRDGVECLGDRRAKKVGIERLGDDERWLNLLARRQPLWIAGHEDHRNRHPSQDLDDRGNPAVAAAQLDVGENPVAR